MDFGDGRSPRQTQKSHCATRAQSRRFRRNGSSQKRYLPKKKFRYLKFKEHTFFEEERRKDPSYLVWRNPLYGRELNFSRKMRASSFSIVEGRGVVERLKVLKKMGMHGKKKASTVTGETVHKSVSQEKDITFF
jgi:hypothetical protein